MLTEVSVWLEVFGRCHPLLLHSPLALLPAVCVLEFGALLLRKALPVGAILTLCWCNAVMASLAAASGWLLGSSGDYGEPVSLHRNLGLALPLLSVGIAVLAARTPRAPFRVLLVLGTGLLAPLGHAGGELTHGAGFLTAPLKNPPNQKAPAGPRSDYQDRIVPILERTCLKCHNPTKKKGELLLDSPAGILAGGENGQVLEPGAPDASPMLTQCELPLDDDNHMPPEGKPQPTVQELQTLRAWIAAGAKFD